MKQSHQVSQRARVALASSALFALCWASGCLDPEPGANVTNTVFYVPGAGVSGGAFGQFPVAADDGGVEPTTTGTTGTATTGVATTGVPTTGTGVSGLDGGAATGSTTTTSGGVADAGTTGTTGTVDAGTTGTTGTSTRTGAASGTLNVSFNTVSAGGRYAPNNIGAVWITDSSGAYVRTLARWAQTRAQYLSAWSRASGGWGLFSGGEPDAVTSATLRSHESHSLSWDSTDLDGNVMPDGSYALHVELTDANRAGPEAVVQFEKSSAGFSTQPSDQSPFTGMNLSYVP